MAEKSFGSKFLGLFVEKREAEDTSEPAETGSAEKTPAELIAEIANAAVAGQAPASDPGPGPSGPTHKVTVFPGAGSPSMAPVERPQAPGAPTPNPDPAAPAVVPANINFEVVFRDFGMDPGDLDRVRKAEDLLKSLPADQPASVNKMIVEASLKAFGFQIEKIVSAAQSQRKALDTYVKVNEGGTAKAVEEARGQIKALTEKIATLHADIEKRTGALASLNAAAQIRKNQVQQILDFFVGPGEPPK